MTQEEFEYWWNVVYQPKYTFEDLGGTYPSRKLKITINFPAIPEEMYNYLQSEYEGSISINFMYHGNNGSRQKSLCFPINPGNYDNYRNSKMIFKNKNGIAPRHSRWSILGSIISSGKKQGIIIDLYPIYSESFTIEYEIEIGYSLRHRVNRWLKYKEKWINYMTMNNINPTSYHASKFKYYFTTLVHLGPNVELFNNLQLPKFLDPTYIEVDSNII